jgi:YVTN family beta-propeller protein
MRRYANLLLLVLTFVAAQLCAAQQRTDNDRWYSPQALTLSADETRLYVAEGGMNRVAVLNTATGAVIRHIETPAEPTGLALTPDGQSLVVTCAAPEGSILICNTSDGSIKRTLQAGHGVRGPAISSDGKTLYVCNRFNDTISVINLSTGETIHTIDAPREPFDALLTPDVNRLFVVGHLPSQPANDDYVAAEMAVIDTRTNTVTHRILLPNGSTGIRDIALSPDGTQAFVSHILARYTVPTSQLEQGWVNTNAVSIIDTKTAQLTATVLLDQADSGAANPWGIACTPDGQSLCVTLAGTHELAVIDLPGLLEKLQQRDNTAVPVSQDLSFLVSLNRRIPLPGNGPRALVVGRSTAWTTEYFSGSIAAVTLPLSKRPAITTLTLGPDQQQTEARRGEQLFNDASICFQRWHSCASCHPDTRADGLNWDLLNDGIGNPKNVVSLLLAHQTPPSMSTGIRANAEVAVRAGIRYILFTVRPEKDAEAIDTYLKSLQPIRSPELVEGKLSPAAERGKALFYREDITCDRCHPAPLFTDNTLYDVGSHATFDFTTIDGQRVPQKEFDVPTLREVWRTAPYLHDGRYNTIEALLRDGRHGIPKEITINTQETSDLAAYVRSL